MDYHAMTMTGRDLPGERERHRPDLERLRRSRRAARCWGGESLRSDAIDGQDPQPVAVLSYKFWQERFLPRTRRWSGRRCNSTARTTPSWALRRRASLVQRRCLPAAEDDAGPGTRVHRRFPPEARRHPPGRRRRAPTAAGPVCPGHAEALSRALQSAGGGAQRLGGPGHERNPVSALWRGRPAAGHWLRQRVDSAAGAGHRAAARVRRARRGGRAQPPHRAAVTYRVDVVGRRSAWCWACWRPTEYWRASRRCCRGSPSRRRS